MLGLTSLVVLVRGVNDVVLRSRVMSQEVSLYAAPTLAAHQVNALVFFDPPVQPVLNHAPPNGPIFTCFLFIRPPFVITTFAPCLTTARSHK